MLASDQGGIFRGAVREGCPVEVTLSRNLNDGEE